MPRFFFETYDGQALRRDMEGLVLPDQEAVQNAVLTSLTAMAMSRSAQHEHCSIVTAVKDETGREIYTAAVTLAGRWAK